MTAPTAQRVVQTLTWEQIEPGVYRANWKELSLMVQRFADPGDPRWTWTVLADGEIRASGTENDYPQAMHAALRAAGHPWAQSPRPVNGGRP